MKKYLSIFACAAVLMTSCTKDVTPEISSNNDGEVKLTLLAGVSPTAQSRVVVGDIAGDKCPLSWSLGDALGLYSTTTGASINNHKATLTESSDGESVGKFTVTEDIQFAEAGATELMIYYPHIEGGSIAGTTISKSLTEEQTQSATSSSAHISTYGFSWAVASVEDGGATPIEFNMEHALSYTRINVSSEVFGDYDLIGATIYDPSKALALSGDYTVDIATGELTPGANCKPLASVSVSSPTALTTEAQALYITSFPIETPSDFYVVIELINDRGESVTIPILYEDKTLLSNGLNVITINNLSLESNSCDWYEPVETRYLADGWAYGETNCHLMKIGDEISADVKARGKFTEVEKPMYAKVILNCDIDNYKKMTLINGSHSNFYEIGSDYTIPVKANRFDDWTFGGVGQYAVYGADKETIIWSTMIWVTETDIVDQTYKNGIVMDRNIGAIQDYDNWKGNGVYFQWGRPTPFVWAFKEADGIAQSKEKTAATNIRYSIERPRTMLYVNGVTPNSGIDWYLGSHQGLRTDRKDDLWGNPNNSGNLTSDQEGEKSIYDPCPKGYKVVSPMILAEVEDAAVLDTSASVNVKKYTLPDGETANWPYAGGFWGSDAGRLPNNTKDTAFYLSSSVSTAQTDSSDQGARCMFYRNNAANEFKQKNGRAHFASVRCMRDNDNR